MSRGDLQVESNINCLWRVTPARVRGTRGMRQSEPASPRIVYRLLPLQEYYRKTENTHRITDTCTYKGRASYINVTPQSIPPSACQNSILPQMKVLFTIEGKERRLMSETASQRVPITPTRRPRSCHAKKAIYRRI